MSTVAKLGPMTPPAATIWGPLSGSAISPQTWKLLSFGIVAILQNRSILTQYDQTHLQGDQAACPKPLVDTKTKVGNST